MNIKISPYTIFQRTPYSKIVIYDERNEKISVTNKKLAAQILNDYEKQRLEPEKYFNIKNEHLTDIMLDITEDYIDYLFIPEEVTILDKYVLENLETIGISLPSGLNTIEEHAFYNCNVRSLDVPDSVQIIGKGAFESCNSLEYIKLPNNIEIIDDELFYGCTSLINVDIPNSVKNIGQYAFCNCKSLEYIKLPDNLKVLNEGIFESCENLEDIIFPKNLETIEENAFYSCTSLKEIILPDTVNKLGKRAFGDCDNLQAIKLPNNIYSLSERLFSDCYSLKNIDIPKCLKYIDGQPFGNSNIKSLTFNYDLPELYRNNEHYIGYDLISGSCIYKLVINNSVQNITSKAFMYSGKQITEIEYLGTEMEFRKFEDNNKDLFNVLRNAKINIVNNEKEKTNIEVMDR